MSRDPPLIKSTIYRLTSASTLKGPSTLTVGQQELFAGYNLKDSQPYNIGSSSSLQITPQTSYYSFTTLSPEGKGRDAGLDEGEDERPYTSFQVTTQSPSSGADSYHSSKEQGRRSGEHISRRPSRRSVGVSDSSPMPIDPHQFDPDELRKARARNPTNAHPHETGKSSTNLQSTLGGREVSKRDVHGMYSGKLAIHEIPRTGAEIAVGVDLYQGLDGDEGKYWLKTQRSERGSLMLPCSNPCLLIS